MTSPEAAELLPQETSLPTSEPTTNISETTRTTEVERFDLWGGLIVLSAGMGGWFGYEIARSIDVDPLKPIFAIGGGLLAAVVIPVPIYNWRHTGSIWRWQINQK